MSILLGIDIGTSGVKVLVCDEYARMLGKATEEYPLHHPFPGWAEQDPEDWWQGTIKAISKALSDACLSGSEVCGIGLSGQMHGSVFVDSEGKVIRPAILWCDVRTAPQCVRITQAMGGRAKLIEHTANPALEGFTAPKVVWLQEEEPANWARVKKLLLPKDYIRYKLTGEIAMEMSDAAGTLLFDVRNRRWSKPVLDALSISSDIMPDVYESTDVCGRISSEVADLTGLKEGTPVVGGGADNACGATGAGIVRDGLALVSIGSSGVVLAHSSSAAQDPEGKIHTFNHSIPHRWYLMGVMLSAGLSYRWFRDTLGGLERAVEAASGFDSYELLNLEAAKAPAGSEGLIFLPYLYGERTPHADANAKGVFFGITGRHERPHMVRAVIEGIIYGLRDSIEIMKGFGLAIGQLRAIGGGAKSPFWRQILADVFKTEIVTLNIDEGPAFGAVLMAGVGAGVYTDLVEAAEATIRPITSVLPNEAAASVYDDYYGVYTALYPVLKEQFSRVDTLNRSNWGS